MILLSKNNTADDFIVTLTEREGCWTNLFYRFVFTHILTCKEISVFLPDGSAYPERFNQFQIDTATMFANYPSGFYRYEAYGQDSDTDNAGARLLEQGKMKLLPATGEAVEYTEYEGTPTEYQAHGY